MAWKALGPMLKSLDARAARIKAELDEAQRLRDEAQHLLAEYKRKQRDAVKEAEEQMRAAQEEAERQRERAEADLAASLKRREQQALDRIAQAETEALAEVRTLAVDLAVGATRKLLAETVDRRQSRGAGRRRHQEPAPEAALGRRHAYLLAPVWPSSSRAAACSVAPGRTDIEAAR